MKVQTINAHELEILETPEGTRTHTPVPHSHVRDLLVQNLDHLGLNFTSEKIQTTHEGDRAIGMLYTEPMNGVKFTAGWINTHDKTSSTKFLAGEEVFICTNGQVFAEFQVARKHTMGIMGDLEQLARQAVMGFKGAQELNDQRQSVYESTPLKGEYLRNWAVKLAEDKIISPSKILPVVQEFENPSFDYGRDPESFWGLNAAATHILKTMNNPIEHQRKTLKLAMTIDNATNFRQADEFRAALAS